LIHADCREVLPWLEKGCVGAVVTDPPFGINFDRATWDDDPDEYAAFMRGWIAVASQAVNGGAWAVWQALPMLPQWTNYFPDGFRVVACCKGFVQYRPTVPQWSWDPVIVWGKINNKPSVYAKDWYIQRKAPFGANRPKIDHPCPKPEETVRYIVNLVSAPNTVVLDPFAGSGTTGRACKDIGRRCIMVEIEEKYCRIAAERLRQGVLFT